MTTVTRKTGINERQFFEQIRTFLKLYGWRWYHTYDSHRSNGGFPDVFAVRDSRAVAFELKGTRGSVSAEQEAWLMALTFAGIDARAIWPEDIEQVRRVLAGAEGE